MTQATLARRQEAEQLAATLPSLLVAAERVAAIVAQGVHGRRRVGIGETFWQYRRYQPGDSTTQIDWRQSAKRSHVFIRENEWEAAESVWIWCDASPSMRYQSALARTTKEDRAALMALALAVLLIRGGEQVALLGGDSRPTTGSTTLTRLATELEHGEEDQPSQPPMAVLPRYAQVVLIGDFLSPTEETEALIRHYVGGGVKGHLLQIVDPAEETLPFSGRTRFEGLEDEGDILVGRPESLRDDYVGRFLAHRAEIAAFARAAGWNFAVHHTDRPAQTALLALYVAMSAQSGW